MITTQPLVASLVMTMPLPHILKQHLAIHVNNCNALAISVSHAHELLKATAPSFYEDFINHSKTTLN